MNATLECIPCFIKQSIEALNEVCDDEELIENTVRKILINISELDLSVSPPVIGQEVHRIIRKALKNTDPYREIKRKSNKFALSLYEEATTIINNSNNPFSTALKFSIAGNILDFALISSWEKSKVIESFNNTSSHHIDEDVVAAMKIDLKSAQSVLILGDNVGEIVFDKLVMMQLPSNIKIYFSVKDSPIINDATVEDAIDVGINELAKVISNGTNAPGTVLEQCSKEFISIYKNVDLIISKGQANFETLNREKKKIYFLTQIKCSVMANLYNYKIGDWIVTTTDILNKMKGNIK